jgi:hypothetical protein
MTRIYKCKYNGWTAKDAMPMIINGNEYELSISTTKAYNGHLQTRVTVGRVEGNMVSHALMGDYSKLILSNQPAKATEKAVTLFHNESMKQIDAIKQAILDYYNQKQSA